MISVVSTLATGCQYGGPVGRRLTRLMMTSLSLKGADCAVGDSTREWDATRQVIGGNASVSQQSKWLISV
jgi:hypothetical protein